MKKCFGNYTAEARKAMTTSKPSRLICRVDADGVIYVTNGFIAYKMTAAEYAAVVQPLACCEPGNWYIENGNKTDDPDRGLDLIRIFNEDVQKVQDAGVLQPCPLLFDAGKGNLCATYYSAEKGFAAMYNAKFIAALAPDFTLRSTGKHASAVAYRDDEPFALILPVRIDDKISRTVKAYFTLDNDSSNEIEELRAKVARLQRKLDESETSRDALSERILQQADKIESLENKNAELQERVSELEQAPADHETEAAEQAEQAPAGLERFAELYKAAWLRLSERHDEIPHFAEIAASFDKIVSTQQGRDLVYLFASSRRSFRTAGSDLIATRNRAAFAIALAQYKRELADAAA